jgi:GT2 family glycosyltransferase
MTASPAADLLNRRLTGIRSRARSAPRRVVAMTRSSAGERTPRVSVVMPVYNGEKYLTEAIVSVLGQTLEELELIAVDDGSQDRSLAILERVARADARVRVVVNERNLGSSAAVNRGWQLARSPYVARLDADDIALPGRLARQVDFLDAHPSVAAVGGGAITIDGTGRRISAKRYPTNHRAIRSTLLRHNCLSHPSVTMRRSALEAVGGYRFRCAAEDYDLWLRLSERFELATVPEPVILYRLHLHQLSVSSLEHMARDALMVRAAAHARRDSGVDPLAGVDELGPDLLRALRIDDAELRDVVERESIARAAILADLGHPEEAEELIEQASRLLGRRAARAFQATTALKQAESLLRRGRPVAAVSRALLAVRRDPRQSFSLLTEWLGPRVPGGGLVRWT